MANMALPTPCMSSEPLQRNHTHAERHLFHGLQIAQWYEFQDLNSDQEIKCLWAMDGLRGRGRLFILIFNTGTLS